MALVLAGPTGLEPAISSVTGRRDNQFRYGPQCIQLCAGDGDRTHDNSLMKRVLYH